MKYSYALLMMLLPIFALAQSQTGTRNDAGITGNEGATSGFFETSAPVNYPAGASSWWHLLDVRHSNGNNNYAMQLAGSFFDQNLYFRKTNSNGAQPWFKVLTDDGNGKLDFNNLRVTSPGTHIDIVNAPYNGQLEIQANTGSRSTVSGAQLEFIIPANTDGSNFWGQARIITVAGNQNNGDATGKMILGTRRSFSKSPGVNGWAYGDDLVIDGGGKTGIGTLSPTYKLNVAQDITMNTDIDVAQFGVSGSSDPAKRVVMGYDVNGAGFGFIKAGWFQHQWTNLALQPNGGNVGIGITNPAEKLAVNGNIRAKEIKVEAANWPDYVFDESYDVGTLKGLESYIKTNKHLPEMPSAKEIEANGIAVSEMLKLQQKKIEELTLHLIELSKKVEVQDAYIKTLNKNVK